MTWSPASCAARGGTRTARRRRPVWARRRAPRSFPVRRTCSGDGLQKRSERCELVFGEHVHGEMTWRARRNGPARRAPGKAPEHERGIERNGAEGVRGDTGRDPAVGRPRRHDGDARGETAQRAPQIARVIHAAPAAGRIVRASARIARPPPGARQSLRPDSMPMSVVTADCGENSQPSRITFSFSSTSTFRNREQAPCDARVRARRRKRQLYLGRARQLGVSVSAVAKAVARLEEDLRRAVAGALHAAHGAERRRSRVLRALPADPE